MYESRLFLPAMVLLLGVTATSCGPKQVEMEEAYAGDNVGPAFDHSNYDRRWQIGPYTWSLNDIEHETIRPNFVEPRIHFALVCAAVGCPPLRNEAYVPNRLEEQLEDQARYVHEHDRWFRYTAGAEQVFLTRLYDWYGGDFEQAAEGVLEYAANYAPALKTDLTSGHRPSIEWLEYDWSLNRSDSSSPQPTDS